MKKKLIILSSIVFLLILVTVSLIVFKDTKDFDDASKEQKHYQDMYASMHEEYKKSFYEINLNGDNKDRSIKMTLKYLKNKGVSMDNYVNYKTGKECDLDKSFAVRTVIDEEYQIFVYYVCGDKSNYDTSKISEKIN